jgi:starch-binding outer membrane protein, SusD/RagB family
MKRIFFSLFILAAISAGITSCKKFLDRPPEGQLGEEEAFKTEADLTAFANGVYTLLGDGDFYGGRFQIMTELLGDEYKGDKFTGDYAEIYKRQNSIFGGTRDGYYNKGYRIVADANLLLKHLDLAVTTKNLIEGQAKFFRAIGHFELVRLFAQPWGYTGDNGHLGIPIKTEISLESVPRATVKQVYDQIIADLISAQDLLPDAPAGGKYYTVTKWAAKALLAKVYFQQNNFEKAFQFANEVIASNKFTKDADYTRRFSVGLSTEGILIIANLTGKYDVGGDLRGAFRSDVSLPNFNFTDQYYSAATVRASDVRKAWYSNTIQAGSNVLTKYNKNNFDLPIIHLTEIILIRAESGAETGGANLTTAIDDINGILTRAYGSTAFNLPSNASASSVISTVRTERELEMVGEGNRAQEIKRIGARSGVNVDRRGSVWNCNGFILQFPKRENDANTAFIMNPEGGCF